MALITYNVSPAKGITVTGQLDKSGVVALSPIAADSYWSDPLVTEKCIVIYKSTTGNQKRILNFDFTQASPEAPLTFPQRCRNEFSIQKVILLDYLGDKKVVLGSEVDLSADNLSLI